MAEHFSETGVIKVNGAWATSVKFETDPHGSRTGALEVRFMQGRAEIAKLSLTAEQVEGVLGERNRSAIQKHIDNAKEEGAVKGELRGAQLHYRELSVPSAKATQEENGISVDRYRSGEVAPGLKAAVAAKAALDVADVLSGRAAGAAPEPALRAQDAAAPNDPSPKKSGPIPVPPHIASKYLVKHDTYHFDDQTVAFVDKGTRLTAETRTSIVD